jgi:hypothetical protein
MKEKKKNTNQCVLDVPHVWLVMCSRREHSRYWISNRYNWHIQHENLNNGYKINALKTPFSIDRQILNIFLTIRHWCFFKVFLLISDTIITFNKLYDVSFILDV